MLDLSKYEKCTPAPWSCGNGPWNGEKQIDIDGPTNFGNTICWVDRDDCDHEESEANARLIADAPQLLAELREERAENEKLTRVLLSSIQNIH